MGMETLLVRVVKQLDRLEAKTEAIDRILVRHGVVLDDHVRRSLANEQMIALVREEMAPLKTHVAAFGALAKALGALGTLVGIAAGVGKMAGVF